MPLRKQLKAASSKLRHDFEQRTAALGHNLNKGEAREAALRDTLVEWLPKRYSVGRGEIIDASGAKSHQMDVVIYDELNSPLIFKQADSPLVFPVESVYGFAEVKSRLDMEALVDGWNKARSVYVLQRQAFELSLGGALTIGGNYKPFSALFAFDAPKSMDELTSVWGQMASTYPLNGRLNMICVLERGCFMYISKDRVWALGNQAGDRPAFVETGEDALLMFMLAAWTAMAPAPGLTIPNPIAYAGGSLQYSVKMFGPPLETPQDQQPGDPGGGE